MAENKRFDKWPAVIPKVGQVIQIRAGDGIVEARVKARYTSDGKTFRIAFKNPGSEGVEIVLQITPDATGRGSVDGYRNIKSYWRVVPTFPSREWEAVDVYFID